MKCPKCQSENPIGSRFCGACGQSLGEAVVPGILSDTDGERRHVTVMFTDLTGYTAMCERLDPEDVKEIMSRIFGEISQVVNKYGGFVEKFIGDAAMALFGVSRSHEDDPVRSILAAQEIHGIVETFSPQVEARGCKPLSMHTGIATGLVVTGGVDAERGAYGVTGDTINLASRLSGMGKAGEILVGPTTFRRAEGQFHFEALEPAAVKGKADPVRIYRVHYRKDQPSKIHRLTGLRSKLIARKAEMNRLAEAIEDLREGKGSIIGICGGPGTGKSRLVEEFRSTLDLDKIQWREGHAYPYSQNIPYFPVIDMLRRALRIEEADPPPTIREKVEKGIEQLTGRREDLIPYIGSLFALTYPELEGTSPDSWKHLLQKAVKELLSAMNKRAPTVICLEDIHWADPSSIELFRVILSEGRQPALFLCLYRSPFTLLPGHMLKAMGDSFREIHLQDLSPSEALEMTESLLKTADMPMELRSFVHEKAEGNPFYLEEVVNALIESETLVRDDVSWKLSRPFRDSDISPTVHGVILARLDRLEKEAKRILQEASVIGRAFLYEILKRVTELKDHIDQHLAELERLDLIRARSLQPELEYMFKHALTQEVVYNGLLKKEREAVHRKIAQVIEQIIGDRLPEYYETLAYHYNQGLSVKKGVAYLMKSGEKSLSRYALDESHNSFQQAYELLSNKSELTKDEKGLLIDLLNTWAPVFHYRAAYNDLWDLFKVNEEYAVSIGDKAKLGMFYSWMGLGLQSLEKSRDAQHYLAKSLEIGEKIGDEKIIGCSCIWMSMMCSDIGLLDDALNYANKALEISKRIKIDPFLFLFSLRAMGWVFYYKGECKQVESVGKLMLEIGKRQSDIRSTAVGHAYVGQAHFMGGDNSSAIESLKAGISISPDPFLSNNMKITLGAAWFFIGNLQEAEKNWQEVYSYCEQYGPGLTGSYSRAALVLLMLAKGDLSQGVRLGEELTRWAEENGFQYRLALLQCYLGNVFLKMVLREGSRNFSFYVKNIGFLLGNMLMSSRKAEIHFMKSIEVSRHIGAIGILGQASLGLGQLYKTKGETEGAKIYLSEAIKAFEKCGAESYLKQAREDLASLG